MKHCKSCKYPIKEDPILFRKNHFCSQKCVEAWKLRMVRLYEGAKHFGRNPRE